MNRSSVLILTYHSISVGRSPLKVSPSLFAEQIAWLRAQAHVISLDEAVRLIQQREIFPDRAVVLTFDDGFKDFHSDAAPVLRQAGLPATVFLPTAYCGRTNRWSGQPTWVEEQPLMNWEQIAELSHQGFSFGAHSVTHPVLANVTVDSAQDEIVRSKRDILDHIAGRVEFFCYPYGSWNAQVRDIVAEHFQAACSTRSGFVTTADDLYVLPRVDAHLVRHPAMFRRLFSRTFPIYLGARRKIRQVRGFEPYSPA